MPLKICCKNVVKMLTMLKLEHMCKDIVTISYLPQHYIQICKMFNNYIATLEQCPQKKQKQNLYSSRSFRLYTLQPHKWCVWIPLIYWKLKTDCWKHCSKIIFKCVNSAMGPKNVLVCAFLRFFDWGWPVLWDPAKNANARLPGNVQSKRTQNHS